MLDDEGHVSVDIGFFYRKGGLVGFRMNSDLVASPPTHVQTTGGCRRDMFKLKWFQLFEQTFNRPHV